MANWAKKTPVGSSNRRKWNLEDRASLNNLKYHFAADGCSEVQYDLARQLLDSNSELDENATQVQGVHWLLCAAQQGHDEALAMLRDCYAKGRGITDSNELEVKACLTMSPGERAARKAARELFQCLSNGGDNITPSQLERRMREIYNLQKKRRRRQTNQTVGNENRASNGDIYPSPSHVRNRLDVSDQDSITEAQLVSAAVNYSNGRLPPVNDVLTLSVPHPSALDHVPCFHRLIFHPVVFFTLLYHRFVNVISSLPDQIVHFKYVILFLLYALISSDNAALVLPMIAYYASLGVMVWGSFKMLKTKHDFIDFRIWSGLFLSYGDHNVDAGGSENLFLRNNMKPYLYFFAAFITNMIVYPFISTEWLPHSEITVMAFALVFVTLFAFMYTSPEPFPDLLILFSFGVNVLAKYPYEMDDVVTTGWRFLDLKVPTFPSFVIGNGIEFCLNCRAILYLLIPGALLQIAKRCRWHGTYKYLIPHCVTLSWLQIFITSSQSATMFGLIRATLGLAGILLFLPLFGVITLMIPVFLAVEWLGLTDPKARLLISLVAAAVAIICSCLMAVNKTTQKYVTLLQVTVCIIAAALLTLPYMTSNFQSSHADSSLYENLLHNKPIIVDEDLSSSTLTWEDFHNYCGNPSWDNSNKIQTQIRCSQLENTLVKWEGIVSNVEIARVYNLRAKLIRNYLPPWLANRIACMYGEKNEVECSEDDSCDSLNSAVHEMKRCNLNKWNLYEYEVKVKMHSGILSKPAEVYLRASDFFGNFTKGLTHSDRVWFKGKLSNVRRGMRDSEMALGSGQPVVDIEAVGCVMCHNKDLTSAQLTDSNSAVLHARLRDLMRGVKYLLNVIFNPLLTFK